MEEILINIVLVNYNGHLDTVECIESLLKIPYQNYRIYVVDNSKSDESISYILSYLSNQSVLATSPLFRSKFTIMQEAAFETADFIGNHKITVIKSRENRGFAAANNIVIRRIVDLNSKSWFWLLNNDTIVSPNCLTQFNRFISVTAIDKIGLIGTSLFQYDNPSVLQGIGGRYNKFLSTTSHVGENRKIESLYRKMDYYKKKVEYIIGASLFISNDFIKDVGLLNEDYFLYFEELDLAYRGRRKGWKIEILHDIHVFHKEEASINSTRNNEKSVLADVCSARNKLKFTITHLPKYIISVSLSLTLVIFNRILRGQWERIVPIIRATFSDKAFKSFLTKYR